MKEIYNFFRKISPIVMVILFWHIGFNLPAQTVTFKIISLGGVAGITSGPDSHIEWPGEVNATTRLVTQPNATNPSGKGGYPAYYNAPVWYPESQYIPSTNVFSGPSWNFATDQVPVGGAIVLIAFDNVAWDNTSAVRTLAHGVSVHSGQTMFANILVKNDFTITARLLIEENNRIIVYRSIDTDEKRISINGNYRHFVVFGNNVDLTLDKIILQGRNPDRDNNEGLAGGGINAIGPGLTQTEYTNYFNKHFTLRGGTIRDCLGYSGLANGGGGIWSQGNMTVIGTTITNNRVYNMGNYAQGWFSATTRSVGGGIYVQGALTLVNATITENQASTTGGVHSEGDTISANNSDISRNINDGIASVQGGNVEVFGGSTVNENTNNGISTLGVAKGNATVTMTNSTVSGNLGRGISSSGNVTITDNSTISYNMNSGIYTNGLINRIENSIVSGNTSSIGGGVYCNNSAGKMTITGSVISNNTAQNSSTSGIGGGIYARNELDISHTEIKNNQANNPVNSGSVISGSGMFQYQYFVGAGGGIYMGPTSYQVHGSGGPIALPEDLNTGLEKLNLNNVTFSGNTGTSPYTAWTLNSASPNAIIQKYSQIHVNQILNTVSYSTYGSGIPFTNAFSNYDVNFRISQTIYEIWNWADLAYINVLIETNQLANYTKFVLMQDLGVPGQPATFGDGSGTGGKNGDVPCPYSGARVNGCYGYQNWNGTNYLPSGSTLLVGPSGIALGRDAWHTTQGWIPIGNNKNSYFDHANGVYVYPYAFVGEFDGNNHAIKGLWIDVPIYVEGIGLFGIVDESYIHHLDVSIANGKAVKTGIYSQYIGGLVGNTNNTTVTHCNIKGDIETGDDCLYIGLLIGRAFEKPEIGGLPNPTYNNKIENCSASGNITVGGNGCTDVGGLAGLMHHAKVKDCHAAVTIVAGNSAFAVGGLIGAFESLSEAANCYATGDVTISDGEDIVAGGLFGYALTSKATHCFATGNVTVGNITNISINHYEGIGGFAGEIQKTGTYTNCYAMGSVVVGDNLVGGVGGFTGLASGEVVLTNCYATGSVTTGNSSVKGGTDYTAAGGLVGLFRYVSVGPVVLNATLTKCYSAGVVTADPISTKAGGFAGWFDDNNTCSITFTDCYYDQTNNPTLSGVKYNTGGVTAVTGAPVPKTTEQMTGANQTGTVTGGAAFANTLGNSIYVYRAPDIPNFRYYPQLKVFETPATFVVGEQNTVKYWSLESVKTPIEPEKDYEIWNWADLAYINVLIGNGKNNIKPDLESYSKYILMQDLGNPNVPGSFGDGSGSGGKNGDVPCPYNDNPERNKGCYGYENWDGTAFLPNGNTLLVGNTPGVALGKDAFDATTGWIPIGSTAINPNTNAGTKDLFTKEFDANGKTISNIWFNQTTNGRFGLFSTISQDAYIHDLTLEIGRADHLTTKPGFTSNATSYTTGFVAGVAAAMVGGVPQIENITVKGTGAGSKISFGEGGIVGVARHGVLSGTLINEINIECSNNGNNCGGIAGGVDFDGVSYNSYFKPGTILINRGNITSASTNVGGIAGLMGSRIPLGTTFSGKDTLNGKIYVENTGTVKGHGSVGGVFGFFCQAFIEDYSNDVSVTATAYSAGGVIGDICGAFVHNCTNKGAITVNTNGVYNGAGGIVGASYPNTVTTLSGITGCYNLGSVSGPYSGGILGCMQSGTTMENVYNLGSVNGNNCGGVIGTLQDKYRLNTISNVYNAGRITGTNNRGIIGFHENITGVVNINDAFFDIHTSGVVATDGGHANVVGLTTETMTELTGTAPFNAVPWGDATTEFPNKKIYPYLAWQTTRAGVSNNIDFTSITPKADKMAGTNNPNVTIVLPASGQAAKAFNTFANPASDYYKPLAAGNNSLATTGITANTTPVSVGVMSAGDVVAFDVEIDTTNHCKDPLFGSVEILKQPTCGNDDGVIQLLLNTSNRPFIHGAFAYLYSINGGPLTGFIDKDNNGVIGRLGAGTYQIEIYDRGFECYDISPIFTLKNIEAEGSVEITNLTPANNCATSNGSITFKVTGVTPPYKYQIDNNIPVTENLITVTVGSLAVGEHILTITDGDCVIASKVFTIRSSGNELTFNLGVTNASICGDEGELKITLTGGTPTEYRINGGYWLNWTGSVHTIKLPDGVYEVELRNGNCVSQLKTDTIRNGDSDAFTVSTGIIVTPYNCQLNNGSIEVTIKGAAGDYYYSMDAGNTLVPFTTTANPEVFVINNLRAGVYNIFFSNDNHDCVYNIYNVEVPQGTTETVDIVSITVEKHPDCKASNGKIKVFVAGNDGTYTYVINGSGAPAPLPINGILPENLPAGHYTVTVYSAGGCEAQSRTLPLTNSNNEVEFEIYQIFPALDCWDDGTIYFTVTGSGNYLYRIDDGPTDNVINNTLMSAYAKVGEHTITIIDDAGCETPGGAFTISSVSFTDGTDFLLSEESRAFCGRSDGVLKITILDGNPTHYRLNMGAWIPVAGNPIKVAVPSGDHEVQLKDGSGCLTETKQKKIMNSDNDFTPEVTKITPATCGLKNGSAEFFAMIILLKKYSLDGGITFMPIDSSVTVIHQYGDYFIGNLAAGIYDFMFEDARGCVTRVYGVEIPSKMDDCTTDPVSIGTVFAKTEPTCTTPGSIQVYATGGSGVYQYSINGGMYQSYAGGLITGLTAGYYHIKVRDANNPAGAAAETEFELTNGGTGTLSVTASAVKATSCTQADGNLLLEVRGGTPSYQYSLNGGAWTGLPSGGVISGLKVGEYVIEVKDSTLPSCTAGTKAHVTSDASTIDTAGFAITTYPTCESAIGAITFRVKGTNHTKYTYQLNSLDKVEMSAANTAITIGGLAAGYHTLTVSDSCGSKSIVFEIKNANSNLSFTHVVTHVYEGCGTAPTAGSITVTASGGTAPYWYRYKGGAWTKFTSNTNVETIDNLDYGFYFVEVKDNSDCTYGVHGIEVRKENNCDVKLELIVFLQGVTRSYSTMTTYLQGPSIVPGLIPAQSLPVLNPYIGMPQRYNQINNSSGPAGKVVDWILIEIIADFETLIDDGIEYTLYSLIEAQALLLQPDGRVVDTNGQHPRFKSYTSGDVRIAIRHRNHLSVLSSVNLPFNKDLKYDFSDTVAKAQKVSLARYEPMAVRNGRACLWAGDIWNGLSTDGTLNIINSMDITRHYVPMRSDSGYTMGSYMFEDVNMDGMVEDGDSTFIIFNGKQNTMSPLYFYIKRP